MPVKFVCNECRRMLSVSRRKIGASIDCPCCGEGIHVPTEADAKARIEALQERRKLRRLNRELKFPELAVFDEPHGSSAVTKNSLSDPRLHQHDSRASRIRPTRTTGSELAGDIPDTDVAAAPAVSNEPASGDSPAANEPSNWTADTRLAIDESIDESSDSDELCIPPPSAGTSRRKEAASAKKAASPVQAERTTSARLEQRRKALELRSRWMKAVAVMAFGAGLFVAGWWAGRSGISTESWAGSELVVSGGVMYTRANGETTADHGAVVIALPAGTYPQRRVDISGLLPGDNETDPNHPGVLAIEEFGGAFARADATGEFQLKLPADGKYLIVMVSAHSLQSAMERISVEDDAELSRYFSSGRGARRQAEVPCDF